MKRNFVVGMFGGLIGSALLLFLLNGAIVAGARAGEAARSGNPGVNAMAAATVTSTFTYQGLLKNSGNPVNGDCDLQFGLYDASASGAQIGITQTVIGQAVSNGLFTQPLNNGGEFGANAFQGDARWLQIAVRCPTTVGVYTPLTTRQALTPAPYAVYASAPWATIGSSLVYTRGGVAVGPTTAGIAVDAETSSGGEAVYAECVQAGNNCYALEGYAPTGDYAGYMYGGKGVYAESDDAGFAAINAHAYNAANYSYAIQAESSNRAGYFKSDSTNLYSLYVDAQGGPTQSTAALNVNGTIRGEGGLVIAGSKTGYVVDIMQNVDSDALTPGDVVIIVGNSTPVLGQIPVVTVKKATSADDTRVAGVVDQVWYAPDPATKAAYDAQEQAVRSVLAARAKAQLTARDTDTKPMEIPLPDMKITDEQGTLHALPEVASAGTGGYVSVVTLGSYKTLKVDASFSAIHAGDLLTTSPHTGYAMKATDKVAAIGAIIGKALSDLDSGTGAIPVLVTLK